MKLRGRLKQRSYDDNGKLLATFEIDRVQDVNELIKVEIGEDLALKVSKKGKHRSTEQNSLMWAIIAEIVKHESGIVTEDGRWEMYTYGIESQGVEYEDLYIPKGSLKTIKKAFRACRVIEEYDTNVWVRCFTGSSKFNKKQMGELIDWFLRYASNLNIPLIDYRAEYEELFNAR